MKKVMIKDLEVGQIGLGCMGMSDFYGPSDEQENLKTLHAALEMGINFFDTADMYGQGHNEELLKKAFGDRWDKLILATKFGVIRDDSGQMVGISGDPAYVKKACEASLKRLGIDTIDLYYHHRPDPNVPVEDTIGAMKQLIDEGKVRQIGISEYSPAQIKRANAVHPIAALQTEYSMWTRDVEEEILDTCEELDITFVAYSPLGRGFLAGDFSKVDELDETDWRRTGERVLGDALKANMRYVEVIEELAASKNATKAQILLAWILHQRDNIAAIPGTRKIHRLEENIKAAEISFTPSELVEIRKLLPEKTVGARYPSSATRPRE